MHLTDLGPTQLLRGARLFDGRAEHNSCDVVISGGFIQQIAAAGEIDDIRDHIVELDGLLLAPGFIDLQGMDRSPSSLCKKGAANLLCQGITTLMIGHCGVGEPWQRDDCASMDLPVNVLRLVGHNALRNAALASGPTAESEITAAVLTAANDEMSSGAAGVSLGLMYEPGRSAPTREIRSLSEAVGDHGGILAAHIRDEGSGLLGALEEVCGLDVRARRLVVHLKACGEMNWPLLAEGRSLLDREGVSWSFYPYEDTNTTLKAVFPAPYGQMSDDERLALLIADPAARLDTEERGLHGLARERWAGVLVTRGDNTMVGQSIATLARAVGTEPVVFAAELVRRVPETRVRFREVAELAALRDTARGGQGLVGSDSYALAASDIAEHPRSYGAVARTLRWAREDGYFLKALERLTSTAAAWLRLHDRGWVRPGYRADLVALDPTTVSDRSTYDAPSVTAHGVEHVWINGKRAVSRAQPTGQLGGVLV